MDSKIQKVRDLDNINPHCVPSADMLWLIEQMLNH